MITKSDVVKVLEHRHGGNGWAVVQFLPDEFCRVVGFSPAGELDTQVFLAWTKMLTPFKTESGPSMLPRVVLERVKQLTDDLETGRAYIKSTHIYYA